MGLCPATCPSSAPGRSIEAVVTAPLFHVIAPVPRVRVLALGAAVEVVVVLVAILGAPLVLRRAASVAVPARHLRPNRNAPH